MEPIPGGPGPLGLGRTMQGDIDESEGRISGFAYAVDRR
jgi:hypothetical protein